MIAIKRANGTVIWLDAVISFSEQYTTNVTKHAIGSGASVSDHIIEENSKFSIKGVISGADWNNGPTFGLSPLTATLGNDIPATVMEEIGETQSVNLPPASDFIKIEQSAKNPILSLLPESLRQFVSQDDTPPNIVLPEPSGMTNIHAIKETLIQINRGFLQTVDGKVRKIKEEVSLIEFDHNWNFIKAFPNCICTGVSFDLDADSGDAIYPTLEFEQVRWAGIRETVVPQSILNAIAAQEEKGRQQAVASGEGELEDVTENPVEVDSGEPRAMTKKARDGIYEFASNIFNPKDVVEAGALLRQIK